MFALKPDYAASKARIDAFWEREIIDRPVVQFKLYKPRPEQAELPISRHSTSAERWMDARYQAKFALADLSNQLFLGDTLPVAWPNLGPDLLSALYGCPLVFSDFGTSWSQPCLKGWKDVDKIKLDWNSPYLERIDQMTDALIDIGSGKFITGITDLHTGGDVLAAMRGPMNLALDLIVHPDQVIHMLDLLNADFRAIYNHFYQRLRIAGLPITTWTPLISDGKYYLPSNDFSALISQPMYEKFFLPALRRDCQFLDRSLYHLDGPGALRHLENVLAIPELDAVQFVPTVNEAEFIRWVGVYQRIQVAGKGLQVTCKINEVDQVMQALTPFGVYLVVQDVPSQEAARSLLKKLESWPLRGLHHVTLPGASGKNQIPRNTGQPGFDL